MTGDSFTRVHIVDDDELVRGRLSYLLYKHGYSPQIYASGTELFRVADLKQGCILLDVCMPEMNGHEVQEELRRLGNTLPVVVMSAHHDIPGVVRAMHLGAVDFIEKPVSEVELLRAVVDALAPAEANGVRRNAAVAAAARLDRLAKRQRQILQGLLDGLPNKGIARRLEVSPRTVEMHRAKLKEQLGANGLSEIVQFAIDAGLVCDTKGRALDAIAQRPDSASPLAA